jgi:uncharacterized protein (DUF3084 family)
MTSAYILIAAILVLGGLISALGDRLGTKVGKARLRLFNLRPRQTAAIVTIITGTLISASTLGILFGLSESLRKGVFQLDDILTELRSTKKQLTQVQQEKHQVSNQLTTVKDEQVKAREELSQIERNFQESKARLKAISEQAGKLRSELNVLLTERRKQIEQLAKLKQQSQELQTQLQQREQKIVAQDRILKERAIRLQQLEKQQQFLQAEIQERDRYIYQLDRAISEKDTDLEIRTKRLNDLESQLQYLSKEVEVLEQYYQTYQELRERKIALVKGQVLASATVRIIDPTATVSAIDRLLRQANDNVIKATLLSENTADKRVVKITKAQVEQLASQMEDGRDYVLRILSAGNYVQGEQEVRVFADLALNQQVFRAGAEIATVAIDSKTKDRDDIQDRLDWLLSVSKFRAQRAGILGEIQVGDGQIVTLVNFIEDIERFIVAEPATGNSLPEIKAIATETTYTAGPLKLNLVVVKDGKIILNTSH